MLGLFLLFSITLWYLIDIIKQGLLKFSLPDLVYNGIVWGLAIAGGMLLAFQFKLDAFVLASEIMNSVLPVTPIEPTLTGNIFGGLIIASGSGGVNAFLKALKGTKEPPSEPPIS